MSKKTGGASPEPRILLIRTKSLALVLTAIYWVGCVFAIRAEEQALERVFGEEYRRYRAAVPRYMRLPRFR